MYIRHTDFRYTFGIIKWSKTDLENIDIATRAHLTKCRKLHPNANKEKITIARNHGGRNLINVHALHTKQIKAVKKYFHNKQTSFHQATVIADQQYTPLNLTTQTHDSGEYDEIQFH